MKSITKIIFLFLLCIMLSSKHSSAQLNTFRFEQVDSLLKKEPRTVMVFIHTDWCQFCQAMKNTTFKNKAIIRKLNTEFYVVYFNAEEKRNILFNGNIFRYKPNGANTGIHELAEKLATENRTVSYPTLCFLNEKLEVVYRYTQFASSKELGLILSSFK
jgi:thioredoxin-related protein